MEALTRGESFEGLESVRGLRLAAEEAAYDVEERRTRQLRVELAEAEEILVLETKADDARKKL